MAAVIDVLPRVFKFGDEELPDPDPTMTPEEVISFYSGRYPELVTGTIKNQELSKDKNTLILTIDYGIGTKA